MEMLHHFAFLLFLLVINFLLKYKSLKSDIDFDSASHLYGAKLKAEDKSILWSYTYGVKYAVPRLYTWCWKYFKNKPENFRYLNIIASSITIILIFALDRNITYADYVLYGILVLLLNSLWLNYMTSSSEVFSINFLLLAIYAAQNLPFFVAAPIEIALVVASMFLFKLVDGAYIFPLIALQWQSLLAYPAFTIVLALFYLAGAFIVYRTNAKAKNQYVKTRGLLNIKSIAFVALNLDFILIMGLLLLTNIAFGNLFTHVLQGALIAVFLAQRYFLGYFFYPLVVVGILSALVLDWTTTVPKMLLFIVMLAIFFSHTLPYIISVSPRKIVLNFRKRIMGGGWDKFLAEQDKQVAWLKKNVGSKQKVYLWGSNCMSLLKANCSHVSGTYYNHNHLFYWSGIENKIKYATNFILKSKPDYIIESMVIDGKKIPRDKITKEYTLKKTIGEMHIFARKV